MMAESPSMRIERLGVEAAVERANRAETERDNYREALEEVAEIIGRCACTEGMEAANLARSALSSQDEGVTSRIQGIEKAAWTFEARAEKRDGWDQRKADTYREAARYLRSKLAAQGTTIASTQQLMPCERCGESDGKGSVIREDPDGTSWRIRCPDCSQDGGGTMSEIIYDGPTPNTADQERLKEVAAERDNYREQRDILTREILDLWPSDAGIWTSPRFAPIRAIATALSSQSGPLAARLIAAREWNAAEERAAALRDENVTLLTRANRAEAARDRLLSAAKQWRQATESRLKLIAQVGRQPESSDCLLTPDKTFIAVIDETDKP
jgi:hypothetical protein